MEKQGGNWWGQWGGGTKRLRASRIHVCTCSKSLPLFGTSITLEIQISDTQNFSAACDVVCSCERVGNWAMHCATLSYSIYEVSSNYISSSRKLNKFRLSAQFLHFGRFEVTANSEFIFSTTSKKDECYDKNDITY